MSGFKLLAIRPLEGCDPIFLKNLKEGMPYKFYQHIRIWVDKEGVETELTTSNYDDLKFYPTIRIETKDVNSNLYSIHNGPKINISAVVGKNGSGKSALTELFLKAMFELSIQEKWISKDLLEKQFSAQKEFILTQSLLLQKKIADKISSATFELDDNSLIDLYTKYYHYNIRLRDHTAFVNRLNNLKESNLFFEIMYVNDHKDHITISRKKSGNILINGLNKKKVKYIYKDLFYSVFLNYSIYGLNAYEIGNWIDFLYHKNDGYQTPVVINPQKSEGNIDVNKEEQLSRYRINRTAFSTGKILDLEIEKVKFTLKSSSINMGFIYDFDKDLLVVRNPHDEARYLLHLNNKTPIEFLQTIFDVDLSSTKNYPEFIDFVIKYFLGKLFKSDNSYNLGIFDLDRNSYEYFTYSLKKDWINNIQKNTSHKYLKLRQVIDSIKNKLPNTLKIYNYSKSNDWVDFKQFKESLVASDGKEKNKEIVEDLLVSFTSLFEVDYKFEDNSEYSKFSSGQKQLINTIETINYHIRNIVSNEDGYHSINVILDEVELYYHPEYQRQFISKMIESINSLGLKDDFSINVLFLTHSPFILSDIPAQNILRLEKGVPSTKGFSETFGANIHDLLANDFFLEDGFMGEFAKTKINEIIKSINYFSNEDEINKLQTKIKNGEKLETYEKSKLIYLKDYKLKILNELNQQVLSKAEIKGLTEIIGEPLIKDKINQMIKSI